MKKFSASLPDSRKKIREASQLYGLSAPYNPLISLEQIVQRFDHLQKQQHFTWMRSKRALFLLYLSCFQCKKLIPREHLGDSLRTFCYTCLPFCEVDGCNCVLLSTRNEITLAPNRIIVIGGLNDPGYIISLARLRSGAEVHITTAFTECLAIKLSKEVDFGDWKDRVSIIGLDVLDSIAFDDFLKYLGDTWSPQFSKAYFCAMECSKDDSNAGVPLPLPSGPIPILQFGTKVDCKASVLSVKRLLTLNVNVSSILAREMERIAIKSDYRNLSSLVVICQSFSPDSETDFWLQICEAQLLELENAHPRLSVTIRYTAPCSGESWFSLTPEECTYALLKDESETETPSNRTFFSTSSIASPVSDALS